MKMNSVSKKAACTVAAIAFAALSAPIQAMADEPKVTIKMFAPEHGHRVGVGGFGWFVDLKIEFDVPLAQTGFTAPQLTGPAAHNNVAPFPGSFSPGQDDRLPGLIVLVSTATIGAKSCQNVANLFNMTGVTNRQASKTEIWNTWIVGAPVFGRQMESMVHAALADDRNQDGIYNDAPAALPDADGNGICDAKDLKAYGIASNIRKATFIID